MDWEMPTLEQQEIVNSSFRQLVATGLTTHRIGTIFMLFGAALMAGDGLSVEVLEVLDELRSTVSKDAITENSGKIHH